MNHNYSLTDFKIVTEIELDICDGVIYVVLGEIREIPSSIVPRLERIINKMIVEHEEKKSLEIPLDSMELGMYINVSPAQGLVLNIYIGYDFVSDIDWIAYEEIIGVSDEDYKTIKRFFVKELRDYAFEKLREIEESV